ncbi:hypothetical protein [Myroides odoratus]|uniref:Lipocalin-like domain-containing protein n=1 Tax=Myroides odoratus TaxID=256 RepID=A0A9Q6Z2L3_MYROD|nr:hypothetical protein [Myroides odoratus]EHQ41099.1 hypothetical protein Myrod_0258 [Myroides odoratus DSM 2801]EKB08268.1 hypothetical protein HMPREF9716_01087 [Myroides odoratus CIP 103059]QQT98552.1 hypothetical protein I6I88_09955 [Myroides odoratus]WQD59275.1 hypothetical protein U0010_09020 [Myroides odoratus]STZ32134.1 Uncharacterised protein [Myroides odoratus]
MKINLKILALPFIIFLYSCTKNDSKVKIIEKEKIEIQTESLEPVKNERSDRIVGKYYVVFLNNFLAKGFELLTEKPENRLFLFTVEFKNTGEIIFNDLTELYDCGNGVLSMEKGAWKVNEGGVYELTLDGEYALEYKFHTISTYHLVELKNGNARMKLNEILVKDIIDYRKEMRYYNEEDN